MTDKFRVRYYLPYHFFQSNMATSQTLPLAIHIERCRKKFKRDPRNVLKNDSETSETDAINNKTDKPPRSYKNIQLKSFLGSFQRNLQGKKLTDTLKVRKKIIRFYRTIFKLASILKRSYKINWIYR